MRTNARALPTLTAALLLAASAVAVPGCCKPEANPPKVTAGNVVTVVVVYDQGPPETAVMLDMDDPDKTSTLYKDKDRIQWVSPDGIVHVTFGNLPFDSPPKHDKKVLKSGIAKRAGEFRYTAELWLDSAGTHKVKIDPRIVIMP